MADRQLTAFEHILLGLICQAPSSGYDLKRIFAVTPMGVYQPSSGALYPALRRLELKGLVQAQAGQDGNSARQRRVYELTQTGQDAHLSWLRTPIEPATVARDLGLHLMRFVMMENQLPPAEVLAFLRNLADELGAFTAQLEQYAAAADLDNSHARLALDHGLAVHRASLHWAERTLSTLATLSATPPHPVANSHDQVDLSAPQPAFCRLRDRCEKGPGGVAGAVLGSGGACSQDGGGRAARRADRGRRSGTAAR